MEKTNIVIGLPAIIEKFFYLFNESLQLCREEFEDSKHYLQSTVPDRCLPRIISLNDYPMDDNLLSELVSNQTDTTPFPDISLFIQIYITIYSDIYITIYSDKYHYLFRYDVNSDIYI
jgi:hypothetical protein